MPDHTPVPSSSESNSQLPNAPASSAPATSTCAPSACAPSAFAPDLHEVALAPAFALGQVIATPTALQAIEAAVSHPSNSWPATSAATGGDLDAHDRTVNRQALAPGYRLLSAYTLPESGEKVWIIIEALRRCCLRNIRGVRP